MAALLHHLLACACLLAACSSLHATATMPSVTPSGQGGVCASAGWLNRTTFKGSDIYPESKIVNTATAALCCAACSSYKPGPSIAGGCGGWTW